MITYLKDEDFDSFIKDKRVLVDFYADWCNPCNLLGDNLKELVKCQKIDILKVNVDLREDLAIKFNINSIPYLVLFENGKILKESVGYLELDQLIDFINIK